MLHNRSKTEITHKNRLIKRIRTQHFCYCETLMSLFIHKSLKIKCSICALSTISVNLKNPQFQIQPAIVFLSRQQILMGFSFPHFVSNANTIKSLVSSQPQSLFLSYQYHTIFSDFQLYLNKYVNCFIQGIIYIQISV